MQTKRILIAMLTAALCGCTENTLFSGATATPKTDTTGPYINLSQYVFTTQIGEPINFSNVTGYDDVDGMMPVTLSGYVNYSKVGEYYPSLICTDTSGNMTSVTITVTVTDKAEPTESPPEETAKALPTPTSETCESDSAEDSNYPCKAVVPADLEEYETVYSGRSAEADCQQALIDLGEDTQAVCELILRNDGSSWGYGLRK